MNIQQGVYYFITLLISLSVHECAHAYAAYKVGDNTAKLAGRITLNPLAHLDPLGAIFLAFMAFAGFGFAWGKPVPVNPANFKNPRRDDIIVSLCGPISNIILAFVCGILFRFFGDSVPHSAAQFLLIMVMVNLSLAIFNLIPIYPLDGSHILINLLPWKLSQQYQYFMAKNYFFVFIGLIIILQTPIGRLIVVPIRFLASLFIGQII